VRNASLFIVLFTSVLAYSTFYLPQPILPLLASEFDVALTDAALLIAVTMVPLGIAPIAYGYLTEYVSTRRLLVLSVGVLCVSQALLAGVEYFWQMLVLRFVQGLVLPAVFTALMTYSATTAAAGRVRNAINIYICATIFGGFAGRIMGGVISDLFTWRWAFGLTAGLLAVAWLMLHRLPQDVRPKSNRIGLSAAQRVLGRPLYRDAYLCIFLAFFVFASILNFIPFRLKSLDPELSESALSLVYLGYLAGSLIAFNGARISHWLNGELRGVFIGLVLLLGALCGTLIPHLLTTYLFAFLLMGAFFLAHSLLAAFLNHHATESQGVVNGLYLSAYYSGGALGGWLPGYLYRMGGWNVYVSVLAALLLFAIWWLWRMRVAARIDNLL
jgi:MFS transporter, YNFM family, putative membrane transport protein